MKKITLIFTLFLAMTWLACDDDTTTSECLEFQQNSAWATGEAFKTTRTIQFPATYAGSGFDSGGNFFFLKNRTDDAAIFYWSLCGFAGCEEYGFLQLPSPLPTTIPADDNLLINDTNSGIGYHIKNDLTEYVEFCENDVVTAVFYYNTNPTADGAFFLTLDDGQMYAALMVEYDSAEQQEVESILQTIL